VQAIRIVAVERRELRVGGVRPGEVRLSQREPEFDVDPANSPTPCCDSAGGAGSTSASFLSRRSQAAVAAIVSPLTTTGRSSASVLSRKFAVFPLRRFSGSVTLRAGGVRCRDSSPWP
jgi:hypothetical protein